MTSERPVLIVDGMNLFIRHFVANPSISSKGEPAGGIAGFLKNLQWVMGEVFPSQVIVVWEGGGSSKKRSIFKEYKSHRRPEKLNRFYEDDIPDTVENRNWQISTIISLLREVPVVQLYVENCEADDVIGYLCRYTHRDNDKVILSSDKDFYQLLDEKTRIYSPTSKRFVCESDVLERFNITAANFCTAKAICGDPSDNVPGIKGVGFKSLSKRFPQLSAREDVSVSDIVNEAREKCTPKGPKIYQRIDEGEQIIRRNWKLMHLDTSIMSASQISKVKYSLDTFEPKRNKINLLRKLVKTGLTTFDGDRFFFTFNYVLRNN
jgi:5'-3' exonuclease